MKFIRQSFASRVSARWILWGEAVRFLFAQFRAGHPIGRGFSGYRWLAHQLLEDKYSPRRKRVVAEFVLFTAQQCGDHKAIDIANWALADKRTHPHAPSRES
jgi:hypothetical protein